MSISIGKFSAKWRVPRQHVSFGSRADRVVRQGFTSECSRRLGSISLGQTSVVRIRSLPLRLKLTVAELDEQTVTRLWVDAFIKELQVALNTRRSGADYIVYEESRANWLARFISDVIAGSATGHWEYEEFQEALQLAPSRCALAVLLNEPDQIIIVLSLLEVRNRLDPLLQYLDELALEELFAAIAAANDREKEIPTLDDLLAIEPLARARSTTRCRMANRKFALQIFLILTRLENGDRERILTPRIVFHALLALDALIELTQFLPVESGFFALTPEALAHREGPPLHPVVLDVLASIWSLTGTSTPTPDQKLQALAKLILELNPISRQSNSVGEKVNRWVSSEYAGLLLLIPLIERLGWVARTRISEIASRHGPRAVNFCLLALMLRILGKSADSDRLDPGILLTAGFLEPSFADLASFRVFLATLSETDRLNLLDLLLDEKTCKKINPINWEATFDALKEILIREFAERIRGFRNANPAFVIDTFFSCAGRIFIEENRIVVIMSPNPFHIALHISGMDESVESVSWLGGRGLVFQLEGL